MAFQSFELTNDGINLLAQVQAELGSLNFTKVKIGSGTYTGNIKLLTDIITEFYNFPVTSTQVQTDKSVKIQAPFNNTTFTQAYSWREIGIYAKLGETGTEILYSYSSDPTPDTVPNYDGGLNKYRRTLDIRNYISDVASVTLDVIELTNKYDFNTVAEMVAATHLVEGDRVKLWGYYEQGDGGGHERIISGVNNENGIQIGSLWANILHDGVINSSSLGANGENKDMSIIFNELKNITVIIDKNVYFANEVFLRQNVKIIGAGNNKILTKHKIVMGYKTEIRNVDILSSSAIISESLIKWESLWFNETATADNASYKSVFGFTLCNVAIKIFGTREELVGKSFIQIKNDGKGWACWGINITGCTLEGKTEHSIKIETIQEHNDGTESRPWLNGVNINNCRIVYATNGVLLDSYNNTTSLKAPVPPEKITIRNTQMQCTANESKLFIHSKGSHRLTVENCEHWDWNVAHQDFKRKPILLEGETQASTIRNTYMYNVEDCFNDNITFDDKRSNLIENKSEDIGPYFVNNAQNITPKNGTIFQIKELMNLSSGVYLIGSDSDYGRWFGLIHLDGSLTNYGAILEVKKTKYGYGTLTLKKINFTGDIKNDVEKPHFEAVINFRSYNKITDRDIEESDWQINYYRRTGNMHIAKTKNELNDNSYVGSDVVVYGGSNTRAENGIYFKTTSGWIDAMGFEMVDGARRGESSDRPNEAPVGFMYFDKTLTKPLFWTGTNWVDAIGNVVT